MLRPAITKFPQFDVLLIQKLIELRCILYVGHYLFLENKIFELASQIVAPLDNKKQTRSKDV